jgi:hypothetical protein
MTAILPKILARGLMTLRERATMPRLVNGDYSKDASKKGATIDVPVPTAVSTIDVTPNITPPAVGGATPTVVQIPLSNWKQNTPIHLTDKEIAEIDRNRHFLPMQLDEAIRGLANDVNDDIMAEYLGVYGYAGSASAVPFATTVNAATDSRKVLSQQKAPKGFRRGVVDFDAEANMLALAAFADAEKTQSAAVKIEGEIGRKYGIDWVADEAVPTHTTAAAGTVLIDEASVAIGDTDVHVDGVTTAIGIGDVFTVAGDTQTYVAVTVGALSTNDQDITKFAPAAKVAWADDAAVTFKATHKVNLVFHRDAFAFAMRPLATQTLNPGNSSEIMSMQDPVTGIVLRLEVSRQHKQVAWEFDILWGAKLVRPELACRLASST